MGSLSQTEGAAAAYKVNNPFRTRILGGQVCPVVSVKVAYTNEIAMAAKTAGIHAMFIDMEHTTIDLRGVGQLVLACNSAGISPIVRVPSKAHWHISRALDSGAAAVVIPHVESVQEVKDIVRSGKYPPIGVRGCANTQPILGFQNVPTLVQNDLLNKETMIIPMIETPGAVDLVDEFLAIDGVDGILIGSNDLCTDMGIPSQYDDARYQDAVTKVVLAGKKTGKPIGIGGIGHRTDLLEKWFAMGASWSLSGQDFSMIQAGMKKVSENYASMNSRVQQARSRQ